MTSGRVQRPNEGNDKDPIADPCPYCGKYVPNDVILDLQSGRYPEPFAWCPTGGCKGKFGYRRRLM